MLHALCYRSFYQDGAIESNEKVNQKVLNFCLFIDILIVKSTLQRCETLGGSGFTQRTPHMSFKKIIG